jgi:hypothetical protein
LSCGSECHSEAGSLFGGGGRVELGHNAIGRSSSSTKSPVNCLLGNFSLPDGELAPSDPSLEQCWSLGFAMSSRRVDSFGGGLCSNGDDATYQSSDGSFGQ